MILTNPKRPVLTGIISVLIISSVVLGGFYLQKFVIQPSHYEFRDEIQLPESVKHDFGTYQLESYNYTPSIVPTPIESNLANVDLQGLGPELNAEILLQLEKYGFALVDRGIEDIFDPMLYDDNHDTPMYISTDFCLHVLHSIFDNCLRIIELEYFYNDFQTMINTMREDQIGLYNVNSDPVIVDVLKRNIAYLSVILYLLNDSTNIPVYVNPMVSQELSNIETQEPAFSAIFGYEEDFTQYKPRGHYTRSETFENYFKAMMYAGRMGFLIDDNSVDNLLGIKQTRMALSLVYSFSAPIGNETVWDYWDKICRTTGFLVGGSDDLTPAEYFQVWDVLGNGTFSELLNDTFIDSMIIALKELRAPKINSMFVDAFEGEEDAIKGFRLFGQSYTPDAYIFQELVFDNLPTRLFPDPLDIFSVFGSERAEFLLESEKSFTGYEEQINLLRDEFGNLTTSDWTQNIYWQWLYSLLPLLVEKGIGYPGYMQSDSWTDKSLVTSLASWVELKHDTILYAKQPYSSRGISDQRINYVEPYPQVYSRIVATLKMLRDGLEERGLIYEDPDTAEYPEDQLASNFTMKFECLITSFERLTEISIKELQNEPITTSDYGFIQSLGKSFLMLSSFNYDIEGFSNEADKRTALIADVFTEVNSMQVLEVAVGNPYLLYVIVQDQTGQLYLTRGVSFSYYQFHQSAGNRMTDEEWQTMLSTTPPELLAWITSSLPIVKDLPETVQVRFIATDVSSKRN